MLGAWLSEDGRKAIEKMGWPEWAHETCGDDGLVQRLAFSAISLGGKWRIDNLHRTDKGVPVMGTGCPAPAALALLRDRAREWLAERCGDWMEIEFRRKLGCWCLCSHNKIRTPYVAKWHDDYDAALIAAVLATEGA